MGALLGLPERVLRDVARDQIVGRLAGVDQLNQTLGVDENVRGGPTNPPSP